MQSKAEILSFLIARIGEWRRDGSGPVEPDRSLVALGLDSLAMLSILGDLDEALGITLPATLFFECASVRDAAAKIAELAARGAPTAPSPAGVDGPVRTLSSNQRAIWTGELLDQGEGSLNVAFAARVDGGLDLRAWGAACAALVARHAPLRTRFEVRDGIPVQLLSDETTPFALRVVDAGGWSPEELRARVADEAWAPFDLGRAPLFRATVFRPDGEAPVALVSFHHIVVDFWSLVVLVTELVALYEAETSSAPAALEPAPPHVDVGRIESALLASPRGQALARFWAEAAADLPVLSLPKDRARLGTRKSAEGASVPVAIDPSVAAEVRRLAAAHDATAYVVLLTAFAIALHRFTLDDDVVVGTPLAGRGSAELTRAIGYFVNPVPVRASFGAEATVSSVLDAVRRDVVRALAHQDYPFVALEARGQGANGGAGEGPFQAFFVMQQPQLAQARWIAPLMVEGAAHVRVDPSRPAGLTLSHYPLARPRAQFDLTLTLMETEDGGFAGSLVYRADVLEGPTVRSLARTVERVVGGMVREPATPVAALRLLDAGELERALADGRAPAAPFPAESTLPALVAARAEETPDAIALVQGEARVTYRQMWSDARVLAAKLAASGIVPGDRVGICLERSPAMVVAMLAVLEAGAAYVPLDPGYPDDHLAWIASDAALGAIVADQPRVPFLPTLSPAPGDGDAAPPATARGAGAGDTAYVMYTSGSTGSPKGVEVPHRAIARLVIGTNYVSFTPAHRVAQASNASFDAATFEIWGALLNGGTLVFVPQDVLLAPFRLARFLRDERISILFLTTALFHAVSRIEPGAFATLAYLVVGGDALSVPAVRRVLDAGAPEVLVNGYGPTETTTFASYEVVEHVPAHATSIPIGRPIANTELYVLGPTGEPAPVGAKGELFIGGPGVAKGYWQRPSLTAERFVPTPFDAAKDPGARGRLYRTGDVVRRLADGRLEFLGRRDSQRKIRGFRVELGEVEASLARLSSVRESVAVVQDDGLGDQRLVAYVVLEPGAGDTSPLKEALRASLPAFMCPDAIVALPALPLTPNGKVDRRVLPPVVASRGTELVPPVGETEAAIAAIWEEVLGVGRVGRDDGFFDLGGHSVLATQVIGRIESQLGVELSIRTLFETPTVAAVARVVDAARARGARPGSAPIPRLARRGSVPDPAASAPSKEETR